MLTALAEAQAAISRAEDQLAMLRDARNAALRAAFDSGCTYVELMRETGMSYDWVKKAISNARMLDPDRVQPATRLAAPRSRPVIPTEAPQSARPAYTDDDLARMRALEARERAVAAEAASVSTEPNPRDPEVDF